MNKSLRIQSQTLIKSIFVYILLTLNSLTLIQSARADAAPPPDPTVGGVGPYQPQKTNVQMMSETVFIDVPRSPVNVQEPKQIKVSASFTMRNQGNTEEHMQVIFPLTRLNTWSTEEALYRIDTSSFVVKVKGYRVPFTIVTTPAEMAITDEKHGFNPDVQWAAFEAAFPVQKDVLLEVEYEMLNSYGEYGEGFTGIAYILETGTGWYGNIGSADITLRFPYRMTEEAILSANPGYDISGREMHWKLKNLEPTRKDNLEVRVIHVDTWQTILNLRAEVQNDPKDADAWSQLGDIYMQRAIFIHEGIFMDSNPHFTQLTLEARQKVVDLRPDWGDAHFKLAELLWYSNPKFRIFTISIETKTFIPPDDPSIQEVLHELDIAWSYGLSEEIPIWKVRQLVEMINRAVPELNLTIPGDATPTAIPPIHTFIPLATNTALSTATLQIVPTTTVSIPIVSPTPIPTETSSSNKLLIISIITITISIGILIYGWRLKLRG